MSALCPATDTDTLVRFLDSFGHRVAEKGVPLSGSVELTARCHLACVHCYGGDRATAAEKPSDLETTVLCELFSQMAAAGCLFLLLTGGEPLVRKDFAALYRHAASLGMKVTVFTNATLVTRRVADLFSAFPPQAVEVTLYGTTPEVHDAVTRTPGSHQRAMEGVRLLSRTRAPLVIKTILMRQNAHQFHELEGLAAGLGARFRFDPAVFPRLSGDPKPMEFRVPAAEAVEYDLSSGKRLAQWRDYWEKNKGRVVSGAGCGAGRTSFHLDAQGRLSPCLMMERPREDALKDGFAPAWRRLRNQVQNQALAEPEACADCEKKLICDFCPPFFALETGSPRKVSAYVCEIADIRLRMIRGQRRFHEKQGPAKIPAAL
ncbi:MAG: radical SAM protein [Deltaproteobacteria bacterium]|nr:radical SAM protein [Deltaproteobacteria bacterium]